MCRAAQLMKIHFHTLPHTTLGLRVSHRNAALGPFSCYSAVPSQLSQDPQLPSPLLQQSWPLGLLPPPVTQLHSPLHAPAASSAIPPSFCHRGNTGAIEDDGFLLGTGREYGRVVQGTYMERLWASTQHWWGPAQSRRLFLTKRGRMLALASEIKIQVLDSVSFTDPFGISFFTSTIQVSWILLIFIEETHMWF